jgi:hypothetical protein
MIQEYFYMEIVHATRKLGSKKHGTKKKYPPEKCLNPEFIKEVECSKQEILNGKGIKFNTVEDFFSSLEK